MSPPRPRPRPRAPLRAATRRFLLFLVLVVLTLGLGEATRRPTPRLPDPALRTRVASTPAPRAPVPAARAGASGRFVYATGYGPVLGSTGRIRRYRVAIELPAAKSLAADFAAEIDRTLGDPRSWIAGKRFRLRRVPRTAAAEFTVYLASARTSRRMCREAGLETGGYTSCRLTGQVIINDDRWAGSVARYGAPLATYRAYAINHEVGHQLGHGHEACPGRGRPAPVMMQQTYGLRGCVANPWPYRGGRRYAGPPAR